LLDAGTSIATLGTADERAREYLRSGETFMASDVVFSEAEEATATIIRRVEDARRAERDGFDAAEGIVRQRETYVAGGAGALILLMVVILAVAPAGRAAARESSSPVDIADSPVDGASPISTIAPPARVGMNRALKAAADLCTDFGRINSPNDLPSLLARAADAMDASGLVVWLGNAEGADLRPVMSHGYSDQMIARLPAVARSADNAAAAAYRSGALQIVLSRPGVSRGAIAAPLLAAEGCVGAITAEIADCGETSDGVQALAAIVAAQLAAVLGTTATTPEAATPRAQSASA
jgi:hypothetical protein